MPRFLEFLWKHRRFILGIVGAATVFTVIYVLVVPVQYTASASIMPQHRSSSDKLVSSAIAAMGLGIGSLQIPGLSSEMVAQEAILTSERLADLVNGEFDLDTRYKAKNRETRLRAWYARLDVKRNKQGILSVGYRDKDPEFAAGVVESLLRHLDTFNRELRATTGRRVRVFLEGRVAEAEIRLLAVEDSIAVFERQNRTLAVSPGISGVAEASATLLIQKLRLDAEVEVLKRTMGGAAPALQAKELEIWALDRELMKLPEINSEMADLLRTRKLQEQTFSYLTAQLEDARIEEARDTPTLQILDPPRIPEEKSHPRRTLTVLAVGFVSFVLALLLAGLRDAWREFRAGGMSRA